jgi:Kinesin motor domain
MRRQNWGQLAQLLSLGCAARTMADTPENRYSSRGHALLTLEVATAAGITRVQMVDLAGSEKEPAGGLHASIASGSSSSGGGGNIGSSSGDGDDTNKTAALSARLREMAQVSSIATSSRAMRFS